jgi:hypothetical protein
MGRPLCLLGAILIYGCFSSPTPDRFGRPELAVGALIALCVGPAGILQALSPPRRTELWRLAGWVLLVYGLTVPLATGIAAGHDPMLVLRDVIPFLFLLLPVFLVTLFEAQPRFILPLTVGAAGVGVLFALRLLVPSFIASQHIGLSALPELDPLYLANAPTVQLAAVAAIALAGKRVMDRPLYLRDWPETVALTVVGLLCLTAMAAVMQRATLGLAATGFLLLWGTAFVRQPLRALLPLAMAVALIAAFHVSLVSVVDHLAEKTALVGFNNRPQEAAAVFQALQGHPLAVVFGLGWGQTVASPAVGDVTVNYTHTLATALWLKAGLCGLVIAGFYFMGFAICLWRMLWRMPILSVALAVPFLTDITLYASYKSLDFGLLLTLIPLWASGPIKLRAPAPLVYAKADPLKNIRNG